MRADISNDNWRILMAILKIIMHTKKKDKTFISASSTKLKIYAYGSKYLQRIETAFHLLLKNEISNK